MSEPIETIQINTRGIDKLLSSFKGKQPYARVGILGLDNARSLGGLTNSELGLIHEFGAPARKIPPRSFLRVPLTEKLMKALEASNAFTEEAFKNVMETGSLRPWIEKLGIVGEAVVLGGFATQGYGNWTKWKNPTYKNNTGMILQDTTHLRQSITYDVVE